MTLSKKQIAAYAKKNIPIKNDKPRRWKPIGTPCIFHPNCTSYGYHQDKYCKNPGHLCSETVIHVREFST